MGRGGMARAPDEVGLVEEGFIAEWTYHQDDGVEDDEAEVI
jgi:hypothetical protein